MNNWFKPNPKKFQEALKYLKIKHPNSNTLEILFKAEIAHLNLYGRPISGINYIKSKNSIKSVEKIIDIDQNLDLNVFSISDLEILDKKLDILDLSPFKENQIIDYKKLITNPEVLDDLNEIDPFCIVI